MDRSKWEYKKWNEVLTIVNGRDYKEVEAVDGQYPICGSGGEMGRASEYLCPENTVIIGRKGNINKPLFIQEKFWNIDTAFGLVANQSELLPRFLFYFCLYYDFERHNKAVTIPSLTKSDLLKIKMLVPPIADQQRIVAELDCLNEMIALKQEQLKEFDKLAQSIFYDMFGDPVTNEKGWDKVFMKQIIKVVGGYAFKSDLFKDNGIPILRIGNINTGEFRPINMVYWIEDDKLSRYVMHPGDLVLSLTGTVGKDDYGNVCILDNSYDRYYLNQRNAKLEIIGNVEKLYLSRLLKIDEVKAKLTGTSRGVRQANISNKDIENLIIPLPPLALQQQFAEKIQAIEAQKELVKQSIAETQHLLDSRMDYYFD